MTFRYRNFDFYKDLRIFVVEIYKLSKTLPKKENYELSSQLRRAVSSIVLYFAEGSMKMSDKVFNRFVLISIGSIGEVAAILDICLDLEYLTPLIHNKYMLECESLAKRLYGFSRKLKRSNPSAFSIKH